MTQPTVNRADRCRECGEAVPIGGWPFCRSDANPEGHTRGAYHWGTARAALRKWMHTGSRSPR